MPLLVEVAETSAAYDRRTKLPLYAAAGIPEVWISDLQAETLERHTEPSSSGYRLAATARRGESLESTTLPSLTLDATAVLG